MLDKIKAALRELATYLQENPGVATWIGGWLVLALAKLGFNVSLNELYVVVTALLPLIAGWHLSARRARAKHVALHASDRDREDDRRWRAAMVRHDAAMAKHEALMHDPAPNS